MRITAESEKLFAESKRYLVGGVGSDERAGVDPHPIFMIRGRGSHIVDVDDNEYVDYQMGYGSLILGHCPPTVVKAVSDQLARGTVFGTPHELEIKVSKALADLVPSIEMVRFSQSGSEAVTAALRTARAYTGRRKVIKFEGHYHGWFDHLHYSHLPASLGMLGPYESPTATLHSAGQCDSGLQDLIIIPWNDGDILEKTIKAHRGELAAVITEPMMCNASCILPRPGYLEAMRKLTSESGVVLIFDEVHVGFRVGLHGAQGYFGVVPDLTVLAKAMGAGYPVSCFGGSREIMEGAARKGVHHGGTYNSNPLVLAAVDANMRVLSHNNGEVYGKIGQLATDLRKGLVEIYGRAGWAARDQGTDTVFSIMLTDKDITSVRDLYRCDAKTLMRLRRELRARGVYTRPSPRDVWYLSAAHTADDIGRTLQMAEDAVRVIAQSVSAD